MLARCRSVRQGNPSKPRERQHGAASTRAGVHQSLTTEQFVLQAARSANVGEMTGRATVYMGTVSSSLIAFGFLAQVVTNLDPFVAAVLPAVFLMGEFT